MYNAYKYVIANEGVDKESEYSFQGKVCLYTYSCTIIGFEYHPCIFSSFTHISP